MVRLYPVLKNNISHYRILIFLLKNLGHKHSLFLCMKLDLYQRKVRKEPFHMFHNLFILTEAYELDV